MASIHIREISPEFLHTVKLAAAMEGKTLKDFVLTSLERTSGETLQKAARIKSRGPVTEFQPLGKGKQ